jgi:hypothetical protein
MPSPTTAELGGDPVKREKEEDEEIEHEFPSDKEAWAAKAQADINSGCRAVIPWPL